MVHTTCDAAKKAASTGRPPAVQHIERPSSQLMPTSARNSPQPTLARALGRQTVATVLYTGCAQLSPHT